MTFTFNRRRHGPKFSLLATGTCNPLATNHACMRHGKIQSQPKVAHFTRMVRPISGYRMFKKCFMKDSQVAKISMKHGIVADLFYSTPCRVCCSKYLWASIKSSIHLQTVTKTL